MLKGMKDEKGMLVIEATFIYPIMFFIIFFLIYTGNIYFQKARIESIICQSAIRAGALFADPLLDEIYAGNGMIPLDVNIEPYHHLFGNGEGHINDDFKNSLGGDGFFAGMSAEIININTKGENFIIYATYTVDVAYKIKFPIRFIFGESDASVSLTSRLEVPATDTAEFIRNTDMVVDYMQRSKTIDKFYQTISKGFNDLSNLLSGDSE